jgi:hypothetical protein
MMVGVKAIWRERMQRFLLRLNRFLEQCYGDADVTTGC